MKQQWVYRLKYWMTRDPVLPGVWRLRDGGFFVRARPRNPRGEEVDIRRFLRGPSYETAESAYNWLRGEIDRIKEGNLHSRRISFAEYAVSVLERKVADGEIKSAKGREYWADVVEHHLIPEFGSIPVVELSRQHTRAWKDKLAKLVRRNCEDPAELRKPYSPNTVNGWIAKMRVICQAAIVDMNLERDPMLGVSDFPVDEYHTYTEEEPNALTPDEVPVWLEKWLELYPQHYAMVLLATVTGLRPSTLRPLRRAGPNADLKWDQSLLLVRRSHTVGEEVMRTTKNKERSRLPLPADLMRVLRWHVSGLPAGPMRESELLFPSETGGFRSPSVLDKPIRHVTAAAGIGKKITPRAMRRTFKDLCRRAEVKDLVSMAISGHLTEEMHEHYQSVGRDELIDAMSRVTSLALGSRAQTSQVLN